jgi:dienelactone hydrolase
MTCTETEMTLALPFGERRMLLREPARPAPAPCLLINLAADRATAMRDAPYGIIPDILAAAGHRVATFDLPYHGELATDARKELRGMAAAMAAGEDPFLEVRAVARALVDRCIADGLAEPGRIVVAGTSRGGLSALHVMAEDERVRAAAAIVPVTDLAVLAEFRALAGTPILAGANAAALVPALANRPVYLTIGETDVRVSADACRAFYGTLQAAARDVLPVLRVLPGATHTGTFPYPPMYWRGAAFLLEQCAEATR